MLVSVNTYDNFVNSINSDQTKEQYEYCLTQFLKYCQMNLDCFLKLPQDEIASLIVNYLLQRKVSRQYKVVIFSAIKHACEMNDVILNWTKMKKFIRTENRDNGIHGKDRGYEHEEIQKILEFSDQRSKTAFLLLASSGIRIGALQTIRIGDLERIDVGEPPAPDDDQFLSCYECGNTFGIHETFTESKIIDSIQTTDNPFDSNQTTVLGIDSRATQTRKGKKPRSKRLKTEEHEDPEIHAEINKGNTVRIIQDR